LDTHDKITVEGLNFSFQKKLILQDIDLTLPENGIIAVTGPSGTGKSTFLSVFNRLWEEGGEGYLNGKVLIRFGDGIVDIYGPDMPVDELRRRVGMVFQAPNPLPMSIYKNIAFALQLAGRNVKKEMADKVEEMLVKVNLFDEVKDRLTSDARILSGGQQQRLCIARALMLDPEILLLDEPASSLDVRACEKIEGLLSELKTHHTILLVSHYQDQIQRVADRVYELAERRLLRIS
jgi:phosphate transport system ATP-binding protein